MRRTLTLLWGVVACSNSADTVESLAPNAAVLAFSRKPFESISLTPATASIAAGATQQFTTTGLRSTGTTATVMPTWSVNGGTITACRPHSLYGSSSPQSTRCVPLSAS